MSLGDRGCFESRALYRQPVDEVFAFFSDVHNLDRFTPRWLGFRILGEPPPPDLGARFRYAMRWRGVALLWESEIVLWEPPRAFAYEQCRGPYRFWRHEHRYEPRGGGTLAVDRVRYAAPGGALVDRLLVRPDLGRLFRHRTWIGGELLEASSGGSHPRSATA